MTPSRKDFKITIAVAIKGPDSRKWKEAMNREIKALVRNETFKLEQVPPGKNVVGCTWVYKIKTNNDGSIERYKARLVAQGYSQKPGEDFTATFAPVMALQTLCFFTSFKSILENSSNSCRHPKCICQSRTEGVHLHEFTPRFSRSSSSKVKSQHEAQVAQVTIWIEAIRS